MHPLRGIQGISTNAWIAGTDVYSGGKADPGGGEDISGELRSIAAVTDTVGETIRPTMADGNGDMKTVWTVCIVLLCIR